MPDGRRSLCKAVNLSATGVFIRTSGMGLRKEYDLPPDPVIEYYKQGVDRTLLREHLKLSPQQRLDKLVAFMRSLDALRASMRRVS